VSVDPLRYQQPARTAGAGDELLTVKVRYKPLQQTVSTTIERSLGRETKSLTEVSADFRFAAAVAAFGMRLGDSEYLNGYSYDDIITLARGARGEDRDGWRAEFVKLVEMSEMLAN